MHTQLSGLVSHVPAIAGHVKFILPTSVGWSPSGDRLRLPQGCAFRTSYIWPRVNRIGHLFHKHPVCWMEQC